MVTSFLVTVNMTSESDPKWAMVSKMNNWPRPPSAAYAMSGVRALGCEMRNEVVWNKGEESAVVAPWMCPCEGRKAVRKLGRWWSSVGGRSKMGRVMSRERKDMLNINCCPANCGCKRNSWSCVALVSPSMMRLHELLH